MTFEKLVQKIIVTSSYVDAGVVAVVVVVISVVLECVTVTPVEIVEIIEITVIVSTQMTTIEFRVMSPPRMQVNISYCLWSACWTIV